MKLHPRYFAVRRAKLRIDAEIIAASVEDELTPGEIVRLLAELQLQLSAYIVRRERHGCDDKRADEA